VKTPLQESFPFVLHGREGVVSVTCEPNADPDRWGYGILGLAWPAQLAERLPVFEASVSYTGEGYSAAMGWIQVVRIRIAEESKPLVAGSEKAPAGEHVWVDLPPSLHGLGIPFISFGPSPTLFDAPASTESDVHFVADAFLTASPDGVMSRRARPCFGVTWGYSSREGSEPELLQPRLAAGARWAEALSVLEEQFPDWTFDREWFE
jgi:hypothetical protein